MPDNLKIEDTPVNDTEPKESPLSWGEDDDFDDGDESEDTGGYQGIDALLSEDRNQNEVEDSEESVEAAEEEPAEAETTPAQEPEAETETKEAETKPETETAAEPEPKTPAVTDEELNAVPQPQAKTPEMSAEDRQNIQANMTRYFSQQLGDEANERLQTEPEKVLPELAASVFLATHESVISTMRDALPYYFQSMFAEREQEQQRERAFFERWPQLSPQQHREQVAKAARVFRAQYPQATLREVIEHAGAAVMVANKISPMQAQAQVQEPVVPVAPPPPPIGGSRSSSPSTPQPPSNMFSRLALESQEVKDL